MDSGRKISGSTRTENTNLPSSDHPSDSDTTVNNNPVPVMRNRNRTDIQSQQEEAGLTGTPLLSAAEGLCIRQPVTSQILRQTQSAFNAIEKTEKLAITADSQLLPKIKADKTLTKDWQRYKKGKNDSTGVRLNTEKYKNSLAALEKFSQTKNRTPVGIADFLDEKSPFTSKIYPLTGAVRDTTTGLYAQLVPSRSSPPTYFLCFPGTGAMNNLDQQWKVNLTNFKGDAIPKAFQQAAQLTQEINEAVIAQGGELQLAGHSLGGGIANYVGLKLGLSAVCFNPAGMGSACINDLGNDITQEQLNTQTHLVIENDLVSDGKAIKMLQMLSGHSLIIAGNVYEVAKDHPEYPQLKSADRHLLDAFLDLYLIQKKNDNQQMLRLDTATGKPSAARTTTTNPSTKITSTTTTTTTTTDHPAPPKNTKSAFKPIVESQEDARERRRQEAREEKKTVASSTPTSAKTSDSDTEVASSSDTSS